MIKVWILITFLNSGSGSANPGGPIVIDNIATLAECQRLAKAMDELPMRTNPNALMQPACLSVIKTSK